MMLRFAEIGLFLLPFVLYLVWRLLGARATPGVLWATAVLLLALVGTAIWSGMQTGLPAGTRYVPAEVRGGQIVPGHGLTAPGHP